MPIFELTDYSEFPPAELADKSGILAVGGDLKPERLLNAYTNGIFPWYSEGEPILWWSPDPRYLLFPEELHVSRSMRQILRRKNFHITCDRAFPEVIEECRRPRKTESGTWITDEMKEAYIQLHLLGYAHSVEAWQGDTLAGGLYGVSLGKAFFGESMFTRTSNASKAAFITLTQRLKELDFPFIDCQVETAHLTSLGARPLPRTSFLALLNEALQFETLRGDWGRIILQSD